MTEWLDEALDRGRVCKKRRRTAQCEPQALDTLPAEWRELLARWVRRGGNSRWDTLRNDAGTNRVQLAHALLDWLHENGWVALIQHWQSGGWLPHRVELLQLPHLRAALGLRDKDDEAQRWADIRAGLAATLNATLARALPALDALSLPRALSRHDLITALQRWQDAQHSGTRRDFALFARGDTKALGESEWHWLESLFDLSDFHIERHTPTLLLAAPLSLETPRGRIDLAACPDFAALTPVTVAHAHTASGVVRHWHLLENRTSFERAAKQRTPEEGVIWLPGFPSRWWRDAVGHLLALAPAPARISCDPDPAGIAIALKAAELWQQRGLDWQPWKMAAHDLSALPVRKPLSAADHQQLAALRVTPLPPMLAELAAWMRDRGEKGEQEGYL